MYHNENIHTILCWYVGIIYTVVLLYTISLYIVPMHCTTVSWFSLRFKINKITRATPTMLHSHYVPLTSCSVAAWSEVKILENIQIPKDRKKTLWEFRWFWLDFWLILVWFWLEFGLILVWFWLILVRFWFDFGLIWFDFVWFWLIWFDFGW